MTRARRAEFYAEGGPAAMAGCRGGACRLWPGTDLFAPQFCDTELPLPWAFTLPGTPSDRDATPNHHLSTRDD